MPSRKIAVSLIALAAMALAGCEWNSVTTVPDTTPPLPPEVTDGIVKDISRVVLMWAPNHEADLAGYNVYQVAPPCQINQSLVQNPMFVAHPDASTNLLYRVTAVDRSGTESAPSRILRVRVGSQGWTVEPIGAEGWRRP
jgi:hypothetical protein